MGKRSVFLSKIHISIKPVPPSRSSIKKHAPTLKIDRTNNQNPIKVAQLIMKRAAIKIYFHVYQEMISSIKKLIT